MATGEQLRRQFENEKGAIFSTTAQLKARSRLRKNDDSSEKSFTAEEVAQHDTADNCWITINDKVYDVTEWVKTHPGGPVITTQAGRDGTEHFLMFHSATAWGHLAEYYVGDLKKEADPKPDSDLLNEFRDLRRVLEKAQMFKSSKSYYFYKSLLCLALLAASVSIIGASKTIPAVVASAALLGLFWQQCAWLFHDFLHHQVSEDRKVNSLVGGLFLGNIVQGYSGGWWSFKHNTHHAATNETDENGHPVDPDIDMAPVFAFSKEILATVEKDSVWRSILKYQHIYFIPLSFTARFKFLFVSWEHANKHDMPAANRILEKGSLLLHHALFASIAFSSLPAGLAVSWLLLSHMFCGALIVGVWVLSHNGMEVHNDSRNFVATQLSSTRNIEGNIFNEWFTGGLNRQIEHHLFPTLPRHNLKAVAPYVKQFCKKHDINYEEVSLSTAVGSLFGQLRDVAQIA
jgi:fatty acid desaturase/predicted heme/steroid binding protein